MTTALSSFTKYADDITELRYSHTVQGRKESWEEIARRVVNAVVCSKGVTNNWANYNNPKLISNDTVSAIEWIIATRKFIPGGRILSQAGRPYHQTDNCFCLQAEDTREGWADLAYKCTMMFMSGGGVGVDYSAIRPYGQSLNRSGGISSGPIPLINMINSIGAAARQGGERRGAIYASLEWDHKDISDFIKLKRGNDSLQHTNISVRFNQNWLDSINSCNAGSTHIDAKYSFTQTLKHACKYGDPGFQFDNDRQILRNACTEIISADDCDSCCLGSINFAAIDSLSELADVTNLAVLFLLCNTLYTHTPYTKVDKIKAKNRRIGLGIMGMAEWFIQRELKYGEVYNVWKPYDNVIDGFNYSLLDQWLRTYQQNADNAATHWSNKLSIAKPIATRAIAPTGTISIAGGHTSPGIEPIFHTAYLRTYNTLKTQEYSNGLRTEEIIDPVVSKLYEQGYNIGNIDTAYTLSQSIEGIERRIAFQAYCQQFVDNAISSTVNLPQYVEGIEEKIAPVLLKYLPQLRGITFYPDGRYNNQPVQPLDFNTVINKQHSLVESEQCKGGSCGI